MPNFEPCKYSERLLNQLINLNEQVHNKVDLSEIRKAIHYAKVYHGTQMRESGEPYYTHPIAVGYMFSEHTALEKPEYFRTDLIITALLHDCLEDTELTKEMISDAFGCHCQRKRDHLFARKRDHLLQNFLTHTTPTFGSFFCFLVL